MAFAAFPLCPRLKAFAGERSGSLLLGDEKLVVRDGKWCDTASVSSLTLNSASRLTGFVAQLRLTKAVDPSVLSATQEIPQKVVRRQTILKHREET